MSEMHLFDAEANEEKGLCGAGGFAHDLTTVQYYLERRMDDGPVGTVCEECKVFAVRWTDRYHRKLEADAGVCLAKAERLRRKDTVRYRNSVEQAELDADRLLEEAREYRQLADRLARETGLHFSDD